MFSRREVKEDIKEGFGEDIEMFFSFREEDREVVKNLSFSFRDLMFNMRDLSCEDFKVGGEGRGINEFRIFESEESDDEGIFFVSFGGIGVINVGGEFRDSFRIDNENRSIVLKKEVGNGDVISTRGFDNDNVRGEMFDNVKKVVKSLRGLRDRTLFEYFRGIVNNTEVKGVFGDIDAYVEHSYHLPLHHPPYLQGLLSPTNLLGLEGQRDGLLKRLLSLNEMGSLSLWTLLCVSNAFCLSIAINTIT